jgi:hypothetical protein
MKNLKVGGFIIKTEIKKKILNHLGKVGVAALITSASLILTPLVSLASAPVGDAAADAASRVIGAKGGKEAINSAFKAARSKPSLALAAGITCIACVPVAGVAASPAMCIACGILLSKTVG